MQTKLMHAFDDPPSQLNPSALDGSFHFQSNLFSDTQSPPLESFLAQPIPNPMSYPSKGRLSVRQSSMKRIPIIRQGSKIYPDKNAFVSNVGSSFAKNQSGLSSQKTFFLPPIHQEESNQKYRIPIDDTRMEDLQTSPINFQSQSDPLMSTQNIQKPGKVSSLMVYYLIKRFMTKILVKRRQKLFFRARHFQIIGDKATDTSQRELRTPMNGQFRNCGKSLFTKYVRLKNRAFTILEKLMRHVPLIYPQSVGKIAWDLILCMVLLFFFVVIPIQICFSNDILFVCLPLTLLFMVFLLCDYLLKLNTIYYEFGKPVTDRILIFEKFMRDRFIIDGLSLTVLLVSLANQYSQNPSTLLDLPLIFFYSQYYYFDAILQHTQESLNLSKVASSIVELVKLILTILFSEHTFSCIWYWIAAYKQSQGDNNWLQEFGIENESWEIKYLDSFYFSTVTMLSVGYGDITPTNPQERILSIIFMLFACIQLSYSVNTVGTIIQTMQLQSSEISQKMRVINNFMNSSKVSFDLQYQVREFLKNYWMQQYASETEEQEKILGNLNEGLRNKIIFEANDSVLKSCPLFTQRFSTDTKLRLLKHMKQVVIKPETVITSQLPGFDEPCLCFVREGTLDVCLNSQPNRELGQFSRDSHFGVESFITGLFSKLQLSSLSFVKLVIIQRSDFLKEVSENPLDYEEYCMIRDQLLLKISVKEDACRSCNCKGHEIENCPLVHLVVDQERVIKSHQFQDNSQRDVFTRSRRKNQFQARIDQWAMQEISTILQNQEEERCQYYDKINQIYTSELPPTPNKPHDSQRARKNLQKILQKVRRMIKFQPKKKQFKTFDTVIQHFNVHLREHLLLLSSHLDELFQKRGLTAKELDDLNFLMMKLRGQEGISKFDQQKDFIMYLPHNNLLRVTGIPEKPEDKDFIWFNQDPLNKSTYQRQRILKVSLVHYMMFPNDYFKKFCKPIEKKQRTNELIMKVRTSGRMLFQHFKQIRGMKSSQ